MLIFLPAAAAPSCQTEGNSGVLSLSKDPSGEPEAEPENPETAEEEKEPVPEPLAPVPVNPKGEFASKAMGFYWTPSENAEYYEVSWKNDRGHEGKEQFSAEDWTCRMGECIIYTELPSDGNYTWTVTAVNESGSASSEETEFSLQAVIPVPDVYRPNTTVGNQRPLTFEWEDVRYNVSSYRIQAADMETDEICLDKWYPVDRIKFINGVSYLETGDYLGSGSYIWRVQGKNDSRVSDWSSWAEFSVSCPDCTTGSYLNTVPNVISPAGIITNQNPVFKWQVLTGAQQYGLKIKDAQGNEIFSETIPPENCLIELCEYRPDLTLPAKGDYTWTVSAYGYNNSLWGSSEAQITLTDQSAMNPISFVGASENMTLDPNNRQIIWTDPGRQTASFRLGIRAENGDWLFIGDLSREDAWCDGITCSIQFHTIPEGTGYTITVIPYSEFNRPGTAITHTFSIGNAEDQES